MPTCQVMTKKEANNWPKKKTLINTFKQNSNSLKSLHVTSSSNFSSSSQIQRVHYNVLHKFQFKLKILKSTTVPVHKFHKFKANVMLILFKYNSNVLKDKRKYLTGQQNN